jgi:hypothetical protein
VPAFPHRFQTIYRALRQEIESGQLGAVSYVQLEHTVAGKTVVPQEHIDELLLADADLLRWLEGEYQQVTALQAGATADGAAVATVTLAGDDLPTATWSARGGEVEGFRLTVAGSERTAVLESRAGELRLLVDGIPVALRSDSAADDTGRGIVAAIGARAGEYEHRPQLSRDQRADACRSPGQARREGDSEIGTAPRWSDLVRAFDVVDAARRSLRRRRTIVLSAEDASERSQFKTQMTAIGCGVLTWTLVGVVLTLLAGAVLDPRDSEQRRAESAGFVVRTDDFEPETAELTAGGAEHVKDLMPRLRHASSAVVVEQEESGAATPLDAQRRGAVVEALVREGAADAEQRTIVRPLRGGVFRALIIAAWCLVFAPLVLYLAAQALIVLARPGRGG